MWLNEASKKPYGATQNNISASALEVSVNVTNWPFRDPSNTFHVWLGVSLYIPAYPGAIDKTNPYQYKGTVITSDVTFNIWLMTYGFLDASFSHMHYDITLADPGFYFVVKTEASFNKSFYYDPNFEVLLNTKPNCNSLGNCNHGYCVQDGLCQCMKGYLQPDCSKAGSNNSTDDSSAGYVAPPPKNDHISTTTIIAVVVGVAGGVIVITVAAVLYSQRHRFGPRRARAVL